MRWFGKAHGAEYEKDTPHVATPTTEVCRRCHEPIMPHEDGFALPVLGLPRAWDYLHYECYLRTIIGGLNHQKHLCICYSCGGALPPDPPELSPRDAARAALAYSQGHREVVETPDDDAPGEEGRPPQEAG